MRVLLGALLVMLVVLSGCGTTKASIVASPSASAKASPSPSPSSEPSTSVFHSRLPEPTVRYSPGPWSWPTPEAVNGRRAMAITGSDVTDSRTTVTMITIAGGRATTRQVISMPDLFVMDARGDLALVLVDQATQLGLLNLQNGEIRLLPVYSAGDLGGGLFSPDGTQAVIGVRDADLSTHRLDIVTIHTGAVRTLLTIPNTSYHGAGLSPLRWPASGILVTPGVWDGLPSQVYRVNPDTGALTLLTQSRVEVTSPGGTMLATPNYLNLGDRQFEGQGQWPNQLVEGPVGGAVTLVAQEKNRAFGASDIADDGSLLYTVNGDASTTTTPTADMGLYLYRGGNSVKVFSQSSGYQWSAWFVGPDQALAVQTDLSTALEIDLVGLCSPGTACTPTRAPVLKVSTTYPVDYVLALD